jgi:integrase
MRPSPRTIPNRILREIWNDTRDHEDRLLFAMFVWTGLRTIEVRRLTRNDVSLADGTLRVDGKGDRERIVPIHPRLRALLVGRLLIRATCMSSPVGKAVW